MSSSNNVYMQLLSVLSDVVCQTINCLDYVRRRKEEFDLKKKFAFIKKGDIILTQQPVRLFRSITVVDSTHNLVQYCDVNPGVGLLVLRVSFPKIPFDFWETGEVANVEVMWDKKIWLMRLDKHQKVETMTQVG